jgi:hypothetical protein
VNKRNLAFQLLVDKQAPRYLISVTRAYLVLFSQMKHAAGYLIKVTRVVLRNPVSQFNQAYLVLFSQMKHTVVYFKVTGFSYFLSILKLSHGFFDCVSSLELLCAHFQIRKSFSILSINTKHPSLCISALLIVMDHTCSICHRSRSNSYKARHPLYPGQIPESGICSRCIKKNPVSPPPTVFIYEFHHHHYYSCSCTKDKSISVPASNVVRDAAELCGESSASGSGRLRSFTDIFRDQLPPLLRPGTKPTLTNGY